MHAYIIWDHDETVRRKFMENLAPIVLFTYNRLDHTRQTIEALQRNVYAEASRLFIFSDAPKNAQALESVQAVRDYLHTLDGFKEIQIIERTENWGLARNIIDGVTSIVNRFGKIIVLEDDIVTSKWFLKYMNDALDLYYDCMQVQAVSGYVFIENDISRKEAYFLPLVSSWGWGTWKRVWRDFDRNPGRILQSYTPSEIKRFNIDGAYDYWSQVKMNADGRLFTWAIFFYELIFREQGVCVYPPISLVSNIGFDNSGEHCGKDMNGNLVFVGDEYEIKYFPKDIMVDSHLYQRIKEKFISSKSSMNKSCIDKIGTFAARLLHF